MDESKRRVVRFLEKEIKTYKALALFLSRKRAKGDARLGVEKMLISPIFYKERIREAAKLVSELLKVN